MNNFCIISGINYLAKSLALYESLIKNCNDFNLYYFAFDKSTEIVLEQLNYRNIIIIPMNELELFDKELYNLKKSRTTQEYYFSSTAASILYLFKQYRIEDCVYLDADIYFYNDPNILLAEMQSNSVMITEHRYTPKYDDTLRAGKYCVQFMPFKNNVIGNEILNWWRNSCIEWCFLRSENGKWADQGYLNDWTFRFNEVVVLKHLGGGVAPWNIQQYDIFETKSIKFGKEYSSGKIFEIVFYHFQMVRFYNNSTVNLSGYTLSKNVINILYIDYINHLLEINNKIKSVFKEFDTLGFIEKPSFGWKAPITIFKKKFIDKSYNVFKLSYFAKKTTTCLHIKP